MTSNPHLSEPHSSDNKERSFWNADCCAYAVGALRPMPIAKISGAGLCSIAVLTGLLWGCIFVERFTVAHARNDADRALQEIRALQIRKHAVPAAAPADRPPVARPSIG